MRIARSMAFAGDTGAFLLSPFSYYRRERGRVILPAGTRLKYRARTAWLEACLRMRLFVAGAVAGLRGAGIVGVARLYATHIKRAADGSVVGIEHLGLVSTRKVTTAGVNYLVDAWQNLVEMENMKYHGCGTGTTAESNADTALVTESTTILNPASTRATGSLTEGGSSNVFRSVGTLTFQGAGGAITEHGLFTQAATGGGTLWDRSVFSAINVSALDSIQFTYDLTASAEP